MATQTLQITLPDELADKLRAKVACGEYRSESEAIEESLAGMLAQDDDVEHWLRTEVVAAYDEFIANPDSGFTTEQVRDRIEALHRQHTAE